MHRSLRVFRDYEDSVVRYSDFICCSCFCYLFILFIRSPPRPVVLEGTFSKCVAVAVAVEAVVVAAEEEYSLPRDCGIPDSLANGIAEVAVADGLALPLANCLSSSIADPGIPADSAKDENIIRLFR